jgi:hypothetical protein
MKARFSMYAVDAAAREYTRVRRSDATDAMPQTGDDAAAEWSIVLTVRPNVLLIGPADLVDARLSSIAPLLGRPMCEWRADRALPAAGTIATLVIRNVDRLPLPRQEELFAWLDQHRQSTLQVVSTTAVSIVPLITTGRFLEDLYYRLNTIVLDASGPSPVHP